MNKPPTNPQNVKACNLKGRKSERDKLTLNFLLMKTIIFKTIAVAIFSIASGLLFFAVANMVNLALN